MVDDIRAAAIAPAGWNTPDNRQGGESFHRGEKPDKPTERTVVDVSSVLAMPEGSLPPAVGKTFEALIAEVDRLRREIDLAHHYEAFLGEEADRHPILPVLNRRALMRALAQMLVATEQAGVSGSFLYLHVGGIDRLRVAEGLAASDSALAHVASTMRSELRKTDLIGYLDGGDFGVALALAEGVAAEEKARGIAATLAAQPFLWGGKQVLFTPRWGLAPFGAGVTAEDLLAQADAQRRGAFKSTGEASP